MINLHSVASIQAAEHAHEAELASGVLMERASTGLAHSVLRLLKQVRGSVVGAHVVLAIGSGNNGGDALFAGAYLAKRGLRVDALTVDDRVHDLGRQAFVRSGGTVRNWTKDDPKLLELLEGADVIIDGLVGIGATGALRGPAVEMVAGMNASQALRIAVDIPSGIDADTGRVLGVAFDADLTVTFGAVKPGLVIAPGKQFAGGIELIDIGIGAALGLPIARVVQGDDLASNIPEPGFGDHKYRRGVVGVAAGSDSYPGAALLCVGGALAGDPGMVQFLDREDGIARIVVTQYPEIVSTASVESAPIASSRVSAWVCGPGYPASDLDHAVVDAILRTGVPVVLDAGALTLLALSTDLRLLVHERPGVTVITPHEGELARLTNAVGATSVGEVGRLHAAMHIAQALDAVVLLKGPGSIIAAPDGNCYVDVDGGPVLATAGSGDVLAGMIGSLLAGAQARGELGSTADVARVVAVGCALHGRAGALAGAGGRPVRATDLVHYLGDAVAGVRRGDAVAEGHRGGSAG